MERCATNGCGAKNVLHRSVNHSKGGFSRIDVAVPALISTQVESTRYGHTFSSTRRRSSGVFAINCPVTSCETYFASPHPREKQPWTRPKPEILHCAEVKTPFLGNPNANEHDFAGKRSDDEDIDDQRANAFNHQPAGKFMDLFSASRIKALLSFWTCLWRTWP